MPKEVQKMEAQPTEEKKLPPALAAAVRCGKVGQRLEKLEGTYGSYSPEIKEALANARKWAAKAKAECEKLGADYRAPDARRSEVKFAVGARVIFRDRRRELYISLVTDEEAEEGLLVTALYGNMVAVQTAKGAALFPRAHLKRIA